MSTATNEPIRMYFWVIHYNVTPVAPPADALTPIAAGRKRGVGVISRNIYANQMLDFKMPRESEDGTPDATTFRGSPDLRNRITAFYSSPEEANAHMDSLWEDAQQRCGAIYAELHSLRLDVAQDLKLAA